MSAENTASMSSPTLTDWKETKAKSFDSAEFDKLVKEYKRLRDERESKEKESTASYHLMEAAKVSILKILKDAGKSEYFVDGIGIVYTSNKYVVTTPKTIDDLRALRAYITDKYGAEAADQMFTVNNNTLKSFVNKEIAAAADPSFKVPGVEAPTLRQSLNFRKDDK